MARKNLKKYVTPVVSFVIAVSVTVLISAIRTGLNTNVAEKWMQVSATVESIEERFHDNGDYRVVTYRYSFDDRPYKSDRTAFFGFVPSHFKEEISRWSAGQVVTAYVNPRNPAEAVLYPEVSRGVYVVIALSALMTGLLTWFLIRRATDLKFRRALEAGLEKWEKRAS